MRTLTILLLTFMVSDMALLGQTSTTQSQFPPALQVGLGVGANYTNVKQYDYYIDPRNNTLQRDETDGTSFVGSVVVAYSPDFTYKRGNTKIKSPGPLSLLGSFNLAQLNTSTGFNTKFSGGLGLGANIQNIMIIGLMVDFTLVPTLRQSYSDSLGKQIMVSNIPIVSLDETNKTYFKNTFVRSISLKFIYNITRRKEDAKSGFGKDADLKYNFQQ